MTRSHFRDSIDNTHIAQCRTWKTGRRCKVSHHNAQLSQAASELIVCFIGEVSEDGAFIGEETTIGNA